MNHVKRGARRVKRWINIVRGAERHQPIQLRCQRVYHGSDYGGWTVNPENLSSDSIVYSVGVGEDISFDLALIEAYDLEVHAFDPTPQSAAWLKRQHPPEALHFYPFGLAASDGHADFFPPENEAFVSHTLVAQAPPERPALRVEVYRLATIMRKLGHERVDLLKMDIEGAEYEVIEDLVASDLAVDQLLVEFHHGLYGISLTQTDRAVQALNKRGFKVFHVSPGGKEYAFIHRP